jgi:hypothetical protein
LTIHWAHGSKLVTSVSFSVKMVTGRISKQGATVLILYILLRHNVLQIIVSSGIGGRQPKTQRDAQNVSKVLMSRFMKSG